MHTPILLSYFFTLYIQDTALEFKALKGLPGPYIKDFLKALGHEGLNALLVGFPTKEATAVCTFAHCVGPDEEPVLCVGRTDGRIVPARGKIEFGWDPVNFLYFFSHFLFIIVVCTVSDYDDICTDLRSRWHWKDICGDGC